MVKQFRTEYGEWALVTGATSGIGAKLAEQVAERGLHVVLTARRAGLLKKMATEISRNYGVKTHVVPADLSLPEGIETLRAIKQDIGLLVHAAGLEVNGAFAKTALAEEERMIMVNVMSVMQLCHHFCRPMVSRGRGGILLVASIAGHMPNPYFTSYAGTKSYVVNFAASLYGELQRKGVDVCVLSPGLTDTPMVTDNGVDWDKVSLKIMNPTEVAKRGLDGLGKRLCVVSGVRNKFLVGTAKLSSMAMSARLGEKMMRPAIDATRI
ncbi:SDR family NAD(P)-dependent oxidoreductase [Flexibacterium corallicola]|uniref:SDR family NAD(P)-dependent oxidoreductase n=1 Tax=Flexibacterium corallicola TaxID=3037259 RepID=UPI00286EBDCB|nr:SDR family NAD(P)-dependent oxidoreductase [Pseudovibrio sp. M1P-2-3]